MSTSDTAEGDIERDATLRSPSPAPEADAGRLHRAMVQASARAKLFGRGSQEQRLGRYVLAEVLGAGGAGKVWAAYDTKLERRVALKLVQHAGEQHDARLLREARALARFSHPNIVQVYDVGNESLAGESLLYIAMELVEGGTLRQWLGERRPTAPVLAMFREIGRGLAAAHEAGFVHRDFKPDNVLIGRDGRPRVVDFGLVRHHGIDDSQTITAEGDEAATRLITRTGAVMGTPAYMAPEQFERAAVDARSDQFSFCVALFEALHGERPFRGNSIAELATNVGAGNRIRPADARTLPTRLRRAIERGLSVDPSERFASMEALLLELQARPRWPRMAALGVGAAALAGGAWWWSHDPCGDATAELAGVWDDEMRASVRAAIVDGGAEYAPTVADTTEAALDAWAEAWGTGWVEACRATRVEGTQPESVMLRRQACLHERGAELRAVTKVIREGRGVAPTRAADLAMGLRTPKRCDDVEALDRAVPPPDPAIADDVADLRAQLAEVRALDESGDRPAARELGEPVLEAAKQLGYRPLVAECEVGMATIAASLGDLDGAQAMATAAFQDAIAADHVEMLAMAANSMVFIVGVQRRQIAEAEPWLGHAAAATERIEDNTSARARLLQRTGQLRVRAGKTAEALALLRESCELGETAYGETNVNALQCWLNVGVVEEMAGNLDEAEAIAERVLSTRTEQLGDGHPDLGYAHNLLGSVANRRGDKTRSLEHYRETARVFEEGYGPEHPDLAAALFNMANRLRETGDLAGAREVYERVLPKWEKAYGPRTQLVGSVLGNIALTLQEEGRPDEALPVYRRAAEIADALRTPSDDGGVMAHNNIGNILMARGEHHEAMAEFERAREVAEAQLAPDHPAATNPWAGIGDAWLALGEPARAIDPLQRCVDQRAKIGHPETAKARWTLARALWQANRRDDARAHLKILVDEKTPRADDAARWLADDQMPP